MSSDLIWIQYSTIRVGIANFFFRNFLGHDSPSETAPFQRERTFRARADGDDNRFVELRGTGPRGTDPLVQDEETGSAFGRDWAVVHGRLL